MIKNLKKLFAKKKEPFVIEPYVVQRKGNFYLKRDGTWTKDYQPSEVFIPYDEYKFKDWG